MMNLKATIAMFQFIAVFLCLAILLFTAGIAQMTWGFAGAMMHGIATVCRDDACQWMLVVCLLVYLGIFLFLEFREKNRLQVKIVPSRHAAQILLIAFVFLCLIGYAANYPSSARSLQILTLLSGMVVGRAFAVWVNFSSSCDDTTRIRVIRRLVAVLAMIVGLLSVATLYQPDSGTAYAYHDIRRWTGPWGNPNLFGLLMGTGIVLAAGSGLGRWRMEGGRSQIANKNRKRKFWGRLLILLCLVAVILLGIGLYHSLSRGAWLGTAVGLIYLKEFWFWRLGSGEVVLKMGSGRRKTEMDHLIRPAATFSPSDKRKDSHPSLSWLNQNQLPLIAIVLSVFFIGFWQLRFSELQSAQRIASVANPNDFSWRNRVSAWQGAARMMMDKPLTGFGWGKAESIYAKRYCTTAADDSAAIQMNDYLMLGISGGVPVMLCFIGYVALALTGKRECWVTRKLGTDEAHSKPRSSRGDEVQPSGTSRNMEPPDIECYRCEKTLDEIHCLTWPSSIFNLASSIQLITTCRAGVIVLLVGFWFDGGLFKLPTAVVFWTLLELSRREFVFPQAALASAAVEKSLQPADHGKSNRWLSRAAWCAVIVAVGVTSFYLFAPCLPVSDRTIAIARHYLILPKERDDFDFLADKPIWHGQKLRTLLDQAELANYNRELINWKLDEKIYRNYVLSPIIEPSSTSNALSLNLNWRRSLWEAFYPRIRHENSPANAAQIVVRYLRERVTTVSPPNSPRSVSAIWRRQVTDEKGFQIIYAAALRSVGVPARLDANGQAEFYDGQEWQIARTPCVVSGSPERNK